MTKEITVGGLSVSVSSPYAEGHVLTAAEAKALNAVRAENIGNNVRKLITSLKDAATGDWSETARAEISSKLAEYDASYEFSLGGGGGTPRVVDPLAKEAQAIARGVLLGKLKEANIARKDYGEEKFASKLAEIAALDAVQTAAKKALAARAKSAEGMAFEI